MIKFLNNSIDDISDLILLTAKKLEIPEVVVEKDIWVSFILDFLFTKSSYKNFFQFKGGTSLSKAYNIINRFSEDIDIVLSQEAIEVDLDEVYNQSKTQRNLRIKKINNKALIFFKDYLIPEMHNYFEKTLIHKLKITLVEDELAIYVNYPTTFDNMYIKNQVKIEIGPISAWIPNNTIELDSYVFRAYPEQFISGSYNVLVTDIDRTFIEKLMILHRESSRVRDFPDKYSRHYYDVYKIYTNYYKNKVELDDSLIDSVRTFHESFYYRKWANFENAKRGTFILCPNDEYLKNLEIDFNDMLIMIYKEDSNIKFSKIIEAIKEIELKLNDKI